MPPSTTYTYLGERGLPLDRPLHAVLDGAKVLRAAVCDLLGVEPGELLERERKRGRAK